MHKTRLAISGVLLAALTLANPLTSTIVGTANASPITPITPPQTNPITRIIGKVRADTVRMNARLKVDGNDSISGRFVAQGKNPKTSLYKKVVIRNFTDHIYYENRGLYLKGEATVTNWDRTKTTRTVSVMYFDNIVGSTANDVTDYIVVSDHVNGAASQRVFDEVRFSPESFKIVNK